ncbi:O-antigen ligase family protein [Allosediminivita pacifica]|uniref:O-antigen ligase family protein n=1 Tax=Allosediminivita pacifica TaxID=1267769 RepID=UPI0013049EDB|nr:hypothetical protein GCM10011324_16000 [Allosediminivita pacifica]
MAVMICLVPLLVQRFFAGVVSWRLPDLLFLLCMFWQALTIFLNNPERFVAWTGQQALLSLGGYFAGRLLVLNRDDFLALIRFLALASMVSVPFALYEALSDNPIILRIITDFTPFDSFAPNDNEPRLGLYRAQFVFVHPIHYGLMSALILVPFFIGLRGHLSAAARTIGAGLIGVACFLSVSSGAVLSILLQFLIFVGHRIAGIFGPAWKILLISGALLYSVLELASTRSAFVAISGRLAFNSQTAYYRTLIWEYGTQQVMRTPIFGNGENYWPRPHWMISSSVDNHWLLMAMVHGLPALFLFAASIIYAFFAVNRNTGQGDEETDRLRLAWTMSLIGLCMSASTVAIWGEIQLLFMLIFGAGFWMIGAMPAAPSDADGAEAASHQGRSRLRYTRFAPVTRGEAARRPAEAADREPQYSRRTS